MSRARDCLLRTGHRIPAPGLHSRHATPRIGYLIALLVVAGCANAPPPPDPMPAPAPLTDYPEYGGERAGVLLHAWTPSRQPPSQPWQGARTQLYTYVLSGDAVGDVSDGSIAARAEARRALAALLREIQAGQPTASVPERELLARANQFIVPARDEAEGPVTLARYDFALAAAHLNRFRLVLDTPEQQQRLDGLGPFFIATRKPLYELVHQGSDGRWVVDTASPILLVDMTRAHPDAMAVYANSYRDAVRAAVPESIVTLTPLRARFASAVLRTAEALPLVAEAYASASKLLKPMGGEGVSSP